MSGGARGAAEEVLQLSSDPTLLRRPPSVEFDALLLALQLCSEVDVFGFPELTLQQVGWGAHPGSSISATPLPNRPPPFRALG
mmetsp:Transcript_30606/g.54824  ORF Transcript_30606/g.54824 Transcript_30606/m.54824 type:complete len:83 (+) Transcript_30606:101-349(+)